MCDAHELSLNFNGMSVADNDAKLGQQKRLMVPKCLSSVIKKGEAPLSMIDCIVLKKYPIYFLEFFGENDTKKSDESLPTKAKC